MFAGYFFTYDMESSDNDRSVFRYTKVKMNRVFANQWSDVPDHFPLYVTFEPNRILFNINLDSQYQEPSEEASETTVTAGLLHTKVLHLPVTTWNLLNDDLSKRLLNLFPESMPLKHYNGLQILHNFENEEKQERTFYSNPYDLLWQRVVDNSELSAHTLVKREIFLDFLFDLTHSDVFKQYKGLAELQNQLKEHYLWQAILAKCEYLYWRQTYCEYVNRDLGPNPAKPILFNDDKTNLVFAWELWHAEAEWLRCLAHPSSILLYRCKGWFSRSVHEIRRVLLTQVNESNFTATPPSRANDSASVIPLFRQARNAKTYFLSSIQTWRKNQTRKPGPDVFVRMHWLQSLYQSLPSKSEENMLPGKFPCARDEFAEKSRVVKDSFFECLTGRFSIITAYNWVAKVGGLNRLFHFNTILTLTTGVFLWYLVCLKYPLYKAFLATFTMAAFLDMILIPLLMIFLGTINSYRSRMPLFYHPGITLPNMTLAIMAGWLAYVPVSNDAWAMNADLEPGILELTWLFSMLFTIAVTTFAIRYISPELSPGSAGRRALLVFIKGFSLSLFCGLITMHQLRKLPLSDKRYLPETLHSALYDTIPSGTDTSFFTYSKTSKGYYAVNQNLKTGDSIWMIPLPVYSAKDSSYPKPIHLAATLIHADSLRAKPVTALDSCILNALSRLHDDELLCSAACRAAFLNKTDTTRASSQSQADTKLDCHLCIPTVESIQILPFCTRFFIFPKLLITYAAIAFFLGFFVELAFQTRVFKGPV